jgi:periplasmic protein CpxP/Spy
MQNRHIRFLGVAMALALVGGSFALAWADSPGHHARHAGEMSRDGMHGGATSHLLRYFLRHQKDLSLTDEQITRLKMLALDQDRAQIRARADVQVAERELRALVWDNKSDLSVIENKVKERSVFEATLRFIGIKARKDLFAVLTPEQREKQKAIFDQMRQSHRAGMFSYQAMEEADHGKMVEGSVSNPEIEFQDTTGSLPNS